MNLLLNWALSCHLHVFSPGSTSPKGPVSLCVTSKVLVQPFPSKGVESSLPSALLRIWVLLWWSRYHTTLKSPIFFTLKFHYSLLFPISFNAEGADWELTLMFTHSLQGCPLTSWVKFPMCVCNWPSLYRAVLWNWLMGQGRLFWRKPEQVCNGE